MFAAMGFGAGAQVGGSSDPLQQLQQLQGAKGTSQPVAPREVILEPTGPAAALPTSPLEQTLSVRAGTNLRLFGYEQLGGGRAVSLPQVGALQDDYVLGVGDEVVLTLRGQENSEYRALVDRDGNLIFPKLPPISAAGRNLGRFREALLDAVRRSYVSTEGFITVGRLRQISVLVSGEVGSPGVRTMTGLSTVLDAVLVSGGIKKSGSLRNIHVLRGGRELTVDLYSVLIGRVRSQNVTLADGDKIIVPALGGTVAVAGQVRRPGIYELPAGRGAMGVREAVQLASGKTLPGAYTISLLRTMPDGKRELVDVSNNSGFLLHDGEIVLVKSSVNISTNQVKLVGAVRTPGTVALGKFKTLHDVLPSSDVLKPGAYMLMGVIDRTDPVSLQRTALPFSPLQVIQGRSDAKLTSNDTIRIFTKDEMLRVVSMSPAGRQQFAAGNDATDQIGVPSKSAAAASENYARAAEAANLSQSDSGTMVKDTTVIASKPLPSSADRDRAMLTPGMSGNTQQDGTASQQPGSSQYGAYGASGSSQYGAQQSGATQYGATQYGTQQSGSSQYGAQQPGATQYGTQQPGAMQPGAMQPGALPFASTLGGYPGSENNPELTDPASILTFEDAIFYARYLSDYWVTVNGPVKFPGTYLIAPQTPLSDVLTSAGGFTADINRNEVEITSTVIDNANGSSSTTRTRHSASDEDLAHLIVQRFDRVVFHRIDSDKLSGAITLGGEVRYPGVYNILRNEKLSSVLERAGGLNEVAFPEGAVFLRLSVAKAEEVENRRIAADMRQQLLHFAMKPSQNGSQPPNAEGIQAIESLITRMNEAPSLGRIPVVADPVALRGHPDLDMPLEPGDSIIIPKRPSTVLVMGEVLRPGALRYAKSGSVDDYLEQAGGPTQQADSSRTIVILPDGSVRANDSSWLSFGFGSDIPAGSTIFVPRELEYNTTRQLLVDSISIFSQLATSAAALAVLSKQ
jgi:Periplasmic protein involved in polysaccharide export